jgi:thioesterase domain-containing protein
VPNDESAIAARLEAELYGTIPLVSALQLKVTQAADGQIVFFAPLAPNVNDKACAFGGSLASLLTLACWSVLRCETWAQDLPADIFVHTSKMLYIAPVWGDFTVHAQLELPARAAFVQSFREKGKAASLINASVMADGKAAATMESRFVAMVPK